jgi:hypothetical protein
MKGQRVLPPQSDVADLRTLAPAAWAGSTGTGNSPPPHACAVTARDVANHALAVAQGVLDIQQEELALFAAGDGQILRAAVRLVQDAQRSAPEPIRGVEQIAMTLLTAAVDAVVQRT